MSTYEVGYVSQNIDKSKGSYCRGDPSFTDYNILFKNKIYMVIKKVLLGYDYFRTMIENDWAKKIKIGGIDTLIMSEDVPFTNNTFKLLMHYIHTGFTLSYTYSEREIETDECQCLIEAMEYYHTDGNKIEEIYYRSVIIPKFIMNDKTYPPSKPIEFSGNVVYNFKIKFKLELKMDDYMRNLLIVVNSDGNSKGSLGFYESKYTITPLEMGLAVSKERFFNIIAYNKFPKHESGSYNGGRMESMMDIQWFNGTQIKINEVSENKEILSEKNLYREEYYTIIAKDYVSEDDFTISLIL
jgi:hypothetical protein